MRLVATEVDGVFVVEPEPVTDERGSFARIFDADAFREAGLDPRVVQCSISRNTRVHTLRGLHYQREPHGETKLVRCSRGQVFDVAVDIRPGSATFGRWTSAVLSADNGHALAIPPGCAHGFLTLEAHSELTYQISRAYEPSASSGLRWDDPGIDIDWPADPQLISTRDSNYPDHDWRVPPP